jgi:hypothetical protein
MSTSLLVLVPIALLFIVSGLCFVGCAFNTGGLGGPPPKPTPFNKYSDNDVIPFAVAYWPLDEQSPADGTGKLTARDATKHGHDGEYKHKGNAAGLFPCPGFPLAAGTDTAAATGFLSLGVEAIVLGDAEQPPTDPLVLKTGMQVDGAFVTVPYSADINPASFTVEAWVQPQWDPAVPAYRAIVDSRDNVGGTIHGFVLWVNEAGNWEGAVADVNGNFIFVTAGAAVMKKTTYLAFTFDGATGIATLFTDVMKTTQQMPLGATYSPNTTQPLVIGAGARYLTDRVNSTGDLFFPIFPFTGVIQDVAIYDGVLPDTTINTHQVDGSGNGPPEPPAPAG